MNVIGLTREELYDLVTEKGVDGKLEIQGITVKHRTEAGERKTLDVVFGSAEGFLIGHHKNMAELHLYSSPSLKDFNQYVIDAKHIAKTFGVDLAEGKMIDIKENPVIDERDIEIASLKAQVGVYRSLMPSTDQVTFKRDQNTGF